MMRYRVCLVPSNLVSRFLPYGYTGWYNQSNIIGSQVQDANQQIQNTGTMIGTNQTQTLNQIGKFPFLR